MGVGEPAGVADQEIGFRCSSMKPRIDSEELSRELFEERSAEFSHGFLDGIIVTDRKTDDG